MENILSEAWPEWQVVDLLGQGSFGAVFEAVKVDHGVESRAAVKRISIPGNESEINSLLSEGMTEKDARTFLEGVVNEFVNEIRVMESFKGVQNIVSVEDYKVVEKKDSIGWTIYIRMELLTPFHKILEQQTFGEKDIIKLGVDICQALERCEQRNIIHRDIKPENIFINSFGDYKLGDFGIARQLQDATGGLSRKGTYNYMAPEVEHGLRYDATVDLYSLGIVLYRLANNNRLPFLETDEQLRSPNARMQAIQRRMDGEALPAPTGVSPELGEVILKACAYEPAKRYLSAGEMKTALLGVLKGTHHSQRTEPLSETVSSKNISNQSAKKAGEPPKGKNKGMYVALTVAVIALWCVVGVVVKTQFIDKKEDTVQKEAAQTENAQTETTQTKADQKEATPTSTEAEPTEAAPTEAPVQTNDVQTNNGDTEQNQNIAETVYFELLDDEAHTYEYAKITGVSADNNEVWSFTTDQYEKMQLHTISDVGCSDGRYYYVEDKTLHALNIEDGTELWTNQDFGGYSPAADFDGEGNLYLCAYMHPDLFIVSPDGSTIKKIDSLDQNYYWAYEIHYLGEYVAITFEGTPSAQPETLYVKLSDYSVSKTAPQTASQQSSAAAGTESDSTANPVSMSAIASASASSHLEEPQYGFVHGASNVIDGSLENAWVENVSGNGEGQSVTLQLDSTYTVSGFTIYAGYQKNTDIYYKNSRPASLKVSFSDGSSTTIALQDQFGQQSFTFDAPVETSSVTFTIESVYAGNKYQDTAISEISLF